MGICSSAFKLLRVNCDTFYIMSKNIEFELGRNSDDINFCLQSETNDFCKSTTTFVTERKNTHFATYWKPKRCIKGIVFICHGYAEYIGPNYEEIAQRLCKTGLFVFGHDHKGHGRSSGSRVLVKSMDDYVNPVLYHISEVKSWPDCKDKPVFLLGHSMGGLISLFTLLKEQSLFAGFIGIGPLCEVSPSVATPIRKRLVWGLKTIWPTFTMGAMEGAAVTRDEEVAKRNCSDPLTWQGGFKIGHAYVLLRSCEKIQKRLPDIKLPILVLQGEKDELVSPEAAQNIVLECSSNDKEYIMYPGAKHALHVELEDVKADLFQKLDDWIENHINPNSMEMTSGKVKKDTNTLGLENKLDEY